MLCDLFRFAPTVNSCLHIGNLKIMLANFLWSMSVGGNVYLRIDYKNSVSRHLEIVESKQVIELAGFFGFRFLNNIYFQSEKQDYYNNITNQLFKYDLIVDHDNCLYLDLKKSCDLVFIGEKATIDDFIFGNIVIDVDNIQDYIIIRNSDGNYVYNYMSCVDDISMDINKVVRGADHIPNTKIQFIIMSLLSFVMKKELNVSFAHIPLVYSNSKKMSKSGQDLSVDYYLSNGIYPLSLIYYLFYCNQEIKSDFKYNFCIENIPKSNFMFSFEKLKEINDLVVQSVNLDILSNELKNLGYKFFKNLIFLKHFIKISNHIVLNEIYQFIYEDKCFSFDRNISLLINSYVKIASDV